MIVSRWAWISAGLICVASAPLGVWGQSADPPEAASSLVTLNFPENVDLKVLVDYVGKRQGVNFIYDEQIGSKRVTIKSPQPVPASSLMTLLESTLKMNGLAIAATDVPGTMRIETARQLTAVSVGPGKVTDPADQTRPTLAVTRVFELQHATPQRVGEVIMPFLSASTANLTALPEHDLMIVTDYANNMKRLEELIAVVDRPARDVTVRFIPIANLEAVAMAQKVTQLLAGQAKARGDLAGNTAGGNVTVLADERTNQVAVVGKVDDVSEAMALIQSLDVPLGMETRIYTLAVASPDRIDELVKKMIGGPATKWLYNSASDRNANILIAMTTPEIHEQIEILRQMLDKPMVESQSPIRFYKLENAKAKDVLVTLQSIEGDAGLTGVSVDGVSADPQGTTGYPIRGPTEEHVNQAGVRDENDGSEPGLRGDTLDLRHARVMADEASNTIIVVAKPSMHAVYEKLIKRLDVRRPQVLVEATVVAIDTTDGFSLGVEISHSDKLGGRRGRVLNFSSFGLSTPDPSTGALTLKPGIGFNGALISADIADVVIQALETDDRVKVVSRPSVLVNDNAKATLLSENEEPFASVNASTTVATTSFAGYSSAGTNITITPQISEGDHLKLEYEITLSSFGDDGSASLPPSRQKNSLASEATIPNGHTIVVGGLTRENFTDLIDRVPVLGRVPVLEYLFSNRSMETRKSTLFVFIRAVILRDDKFEDLKVLSGDAAGQSELAGDYPASEPVEIR